MWPQRPADDTQAADDLTISRINLSRMPRAGQTAGEAISKTEVTVDDILRSRNVLYEYLDSL